MNRKDGTPFDINESLDIEDLNYIHEKLKSSSTFVLIGGQARVGKTTTAKALAESLINQGYVPLLLSFAEPIKRELSEMGINKGDMAYRQAAIEVALANRILNPDHYVLPARERALAFIQKHESLGHKPVVIIDDLRYLNELRIAPEDKIISIMLVPEVQKNLEDWDASFRSDPSESLGRVQGYSEKDPLSISHLPIGEDAFVKIEDLENTNLDLYITLIHTKNWKKTHDEIIEAITLIVDTLYTNYNKENPNGNPS